MFDRSEFLRGQWLKEEYPQVPGRWVPINAGLKETTLPVGAVFPGAEGRTLDLYDPAVMTEPAVTRARQRTADVAGSATAQPESHRGDVDLHFDKESGFLVKIVTHRKYPKPGRVLSSRRSSRIIKSPTATNDPRR
jgi:hypothetical protein